MTKNKKRDIKGREQDRISASLRHTARLLIRSQEAITMFARSSVNGLDLWTAHAHSDDRGSGRNNKQGSTPVSRRPHSC